MKISRWQLIGIVFLVGIIGTVLAWLLYTQWYIFDTSTFDISMKITNQSKIGFNADTEYVAFGIVPYGGTSERQVRLISAHDAVAHFQFDPPFDRWVRPKTYPVVLTANEPKTVYLEAYAPFGEEPGNYTGTGRIVYTRRLAWQ